jgi:putative membrane protein
MMKIAATGVLLGILAVSTGCQNMDHMMGKKPHHGMMDMKHKMDMKHQLNDAQIMSVLSTANMGEITQGQIALQKAQRAEVRSFAQKMVTEHTANDQMGQALAARLGVTPQANPISMKLKKESDDVVMKLNKADAKDIDKDYIHSQVKVHKMVLETIDKKLLPSAQNAELRTLLTQTRGAVAMHLQMAEQLKDMMK